MPPNQLSLFGDDPPPSTPAATVEPAPVSDAVRSLAAALPRAIHLGTSSWSFPGWTGLVYAPRQGRPATEQQLARSGLSAYARYPLFRTVSLDRTFYAPLTATEFADYARQVPDGFRFVVKAPAAITDPVIRRSGSGEAARDNPSFLDVAAAASSFVHPAITGLADRAGPLVFQFPPLGRRLLADVPRLAARIAAFIAVLPRPRAARGTAVYAVEFRDPQLVDPQVARLLMDASAVPCLALHARMPPVAEQAAAFGLDQPGCTLPLVVRWNLHAGRQYEEARSDYFPFDRLVEEDVGTRQPLGRLARDAAAAGRDVFITINNKAEGSAPCSVAALAAEIAPGPHVPYDAGSFS
jgi:uncharacterized protein YecE (DUF72 family)